MVKTLAQQALENNSADISTATKLEIPADLMPQLIDIELAIIKDEMESNPNKAQEANELLKQANAAIESGEIAKENPELDIKPFTDVSEMYRFFTTDPKETESYKMLSELSVVHFNDNSSLVFSNDNEGNTIATATDSATLTDLNEQKIRKIRDIVFDEMKPLSSFQPQQPDRKSVV